MKIKTGELTGAALDWAVAKATQIPLYQCGEGWPGNRVVNEESLRRPIVTVGLTGRMLLEGPKASENKEWSPSTDWAQGGPLIQREGIGIRQYGDFLESRWQADKWAFKFVDPMATGPTPLIAAMRCLCSAKLGDEVEIPEKLLP